MKYINIDAFRNTPLIEEPFPYLVLPNFIQHAELAALLNEYPEVPGTGSYPNDTLSISPTFQALIDDMKSSEFRQAVADKLSMDLSDKPTMMTIRGHCRATDGKIHHDSDSKLVLRLLKNDHDLNAIIAEVPPLAGTLIMFKVTPNSWHGHTSYEGPRRAIQMNYVVSEAIITKESRRHRISAFVKKLTALFKHGK